MYSIFYDLETSDKHPIGQILNFAFVALDPNWKEIAKLTGDIKISRLQLPRASAIMANRINVLEHQKTAKLSEARAMQEIAQFFDKISKIAKSSVALIGYNSGTFDLNYLRTSMIRNGINPYFSKHIHRDLLLVGKKLLVTNDKFYPYSLDSANSKTSLRLENLCHNFKLLSGKQAHESLADVKLTIDLARVYNENYNIDVRKYSSYEIPAGLKPGTITFRLDPFYNKNSAVRIKILPMVLLAESSSATLWINLHDYAEGKGRESIKYCKKASDFFIHPDYDTGVYKEIASKAMEEFKGINFSNYFQEMSCDVEQFIYKLDGDERNALEVAIHDGNIHFLNEISKVKRDAKVLHIRYKLANYELTGDDTAMQKQLMSYAEYRYGGKLQLDKTVPEDYEKKLQEGKKMEVFHPTLQDLYQEIEDCKKDADASDLKLLSALKKFYDQSEIVGVLGSERRL